MNDAATICSAERGKGDCPLYLRPAPVLVAVLAGIVLFTGLGKIVFWGDEAETAILGRNTLAHGVPTAWDGRNLVESLGIGFNDDLVWNQQPWMQLYVVAGAFAVFGEGTATARLPFAVAAWVAIILTYVLVLKETGSRGQALAAMALLTVNVQFLLFARQCRYHALLALGVVLMMLAWRRIERKGGWFLVALAGALLFHSNYLAFLPTMGAFWLYALLWQRRRKTLVPLVIATALVAATGIGWMLAAGVFDSLGGQLPQRDLAQCLSWLKAYSGRAGRWMIPFVFLVGIVVLLAKRRIPERRLVILSLFILVAHLVFIPLVAPALVLRYAVGVFPVAAILVASLLGALWRWKKPVAAAVAAVFVATHLFNTADIVIVNLLKLPFRSEGAFQNAYLTGDRDSFFLRRECADFARELVRGFPENPNAGIVAFVNEHVKGDEIVVTGHDWLPIIFYTDARVMGTYVPRSSRRAHGRPETLPGYTSNPWNEDIFWYIRRRPYLEDVFADIIERGEKGEYRITRFDTRYPDIPHGNDPEIDSRIRGTALDDTDRIECYRVERPAVR